MSGAYSSMRLTPHSYETGVGFQDAIIRYYFHEGISFEEVLLYGDSVYSTTYRVWEPVSPTRARLSRVPEDYSSLRWIELDLVTPEDGCPFVTWTWIDDEIDPGGGPTMWPGEVCVVVTEPVPEGDRETYHLEWCGEPPPGCAIDGCPCDES
jgi:hypothetical protein